MFALLSASYMLALLTADPCISEMENVPGKNETIVYKCYPPDVKSLKDETRAPAIVLPPPVKPPETKLAENKTKKASHRCGSKTPVWYTKNGNRRYRCK